MDRRTTLQWFLAASAAPLLRERAARADVVLVDAVAATAAPSVQGYGTDPNLVASYHPGELWPLTLTAEQRRMAALLADIMIPSDDHSPSASAVGVVEFIDEWISAPYDTFRLDRDSVLNGFAWLDSDAARRFGTAFVELSSAQHHAICDAISDESRAAVASRDAARFFALFRDLTAGGFYSSPAGRKDLSYIGNVPLTRFDGPPLALLKALGLP